MELRDLIVTPIILFLIYAGAYWIRPRVTDSINRKYFIPALTVRIIGALAVGFIYQFYYDGGDTFNFHTHGSRIIWEAFMDSPGSGLKLIFGKAEYAGDTFRYASQIPFYRDPSSYFVIRVAAILDIFTFSSYSATAILFATISFAGMWLFFLTFYRIYPHLNGWIALGCFFLPSVFFWGSGLLKDTLTLASMGLMVYSVYDIFIDKKFSIMSIVLLILGLWVVFVVKKYILLCFLPAALFWIYAERLFRVKSFVLKAIMAPFIITAIIFSGYWAITKVGEDDSRYALDKIALTTKITAYDIGFYSGRDAGSGYSLGELDGSYESMFRLAPAAINVALFRPYLWEVNNPLMMLSSLESTGILLLVIFTLLRKRILFFKACGNPNVLFSMVFSITFAFAVGVSTFNFGTLARYKIPLLPFLIIGLAIVIDYSNNVKKLEALERTE